MLVRCGSAFCACFRVFECKCVRLSFLVNVCVRSVFVYACLHLCVCVCVCERERERENVYPRV